MERRHRGFLILLFALAILAKELALYFFAAYAIAYAIQKRWPETYAVALCALLRALPQAGLWLRLDELPSDTGPGSACAPQPFYGDLQMGFTTAMALMPLVILLLAIIRFGIGLHLFVRKRPSMDPIPVDLRTNSSLIIFCPSKSAGRCQSLAGSRLG